MYAKKIVLSLYEKKFKTEGRLDKFIRKNNQKADIKLDEIHNCLKRRKVLFTILPSTETNLEVKGCIMEAVYFCFLNRYFHGTFSEPSTVPS